MAKKSKRRDAAAVEAPGDERHHTSASGAGTGAHRKSRRRGGDDADEEVVKERDAPQDAGAAAAPNSGEGKKPKLKKRKNSKQEQSSCTAPDADAIAAGRSQGCSDMEGVTTSPTFAEDSSCPEGISMERGAPEGENPKLKKLKNNKREQCPSAAPEDGAVVADSYGNGCANGQGATGDGEASLSAGHGDDQECPEVNIAEKGTPDRKKPRLNKRRKKNSEGNSPYAVASRKAGITCTNLEGASGDAEASLSPRYGDDPDCPEVNIAEMGAQERKKTKIKKQKNKQETSLSAVPGDGAVEADKSGNVCTDREGASGDADVSMSPSVREDPDRLEVNIGEMGTQERKKPKLNQRKKSKQETSPSAVSDASNFLADKFGHGSTNLESAAQDEDVTFSPRSGVHLNCPEVNIAEDSVVLDTGAVVMDKCGNNCTNEEVGSGDADVSASPGNGNDPIFPNAPEDLVDGKQGNENSSQKPNQKKQKKINQVNVTKAPVVGVAWTGSIRKMDFEIQPDLSEDKKIAKSMDPDATANNVSLTLVQGVETNAMAKPVCLQARNDKSDFISKAPTSGGNHKDKVQDIYSPRGSLIRFQRKKLLILDLNGLLADINQDHHNAHMSHARVRGKLVFKRPYCDDFLKFCVQNFELGIWSSRMKANVDSVVNILMKDLKQHLLFCWDLSKCTTTGHNTLENQYKPLVLKELKKLWNKEEPGLPWEHGEFSPLNTLLVDDSPYKALRNPPHTAIFPQPYSYHNKKDDSLGPGGDLRVYLENLAAADDVQSYVHEHPFGQPSIVESDPHWNFYVQILGKLAKPVA